jgi:hypothetical protein
MRRKIWYSMIVALVAAVFFSPPAAAQDPDRDEEREKASEQAEQYAWSPTWEYTLAPYFWFSGAKGSAKVAGEDFDIDLGGLGELNAVFSFQLEAQRKKLAGWLAITVTDLEQETTTEGGEAGTFRLKVLRPEMAAAYRFFASRKMAFEAYAGFRYTDWRPRFELKVQVPGEPTAIEVQKGWFDPIIGARFRARIGPRIPVFIRGDVGGFGVGAELAWLAQAGLGYMFSPGFGLAGSYRYYYTDYKSGSVESGYAYDADQHGPLVGIMLLF